MAFQPKFRVTSHLLQMIEEIGAYREKIESATVQVPWIPALQRDARIRNTHGSTAIEGNPLSLEEVKILEKEGDLDFVTERSKKEILNYLAGLKFIEKNPRIKKMAHEQILKLHFLVAKDVLHQGKAGEYRKMQVVVGNYFPPPPQQVRKMMTELLQWWNADSAEWSPVISSAILHYQFEAIHPFADGNGRTGRLLALWELYRRGFDTHHIFSVDEIYWENRPRYYQALNAVQAGKGDLTGWLEFTAEALHLTLERVWLRVQQFSAKSGMKKIVLNAKQERLLNLLREKRVLSPREIWKIFQISKQGAMNLLNPLLEAGLIQRVGSKKSGKYILSNP